ncbi:MYXO-CTERM domain-containing protein [Streptomyces sp. SLBN-118]|uniref:SCO2322 family protein n=1 Tax=Streptomyces sp. SLBN-118 TaxID=2768454 RepID=UPI00114DA407|nr:SCO2322 family protein [Streptomyces sp. SLBN-118]TQK44199.1 MYXO-CTERM domain-containing protein [Streptomyces sp. SLBN-118]
MRTRLLSLVLALGAALTVLGAGPAQAAGYRYWSFWQSSGDTWTYATEGPATARPEDGAVNGFRFSVSEDGADSARPRRAPDFAAICAGTPAKADAKRIALVIDSGTPADAPSGETPHTLRVACAQVPKDATSAEALASVAKPLRYNSEALLCAISGYPKTGCGEQVAPSEPKSSASPKPSAGGKDDGGPSVGVVAGIAAVAALGAAAVWQSRRRRR